MPLASFLRAQRRGRVLRHAAAVAVSVAALLLAALFWTSPARAQAVTLNPSGVQRLDPHGATVGTGNSGRNQLNWLNFADCENDLRLSFPLVLDATALTNSSLTLEVWVGDTNADCGATTSRLQPGASTQLCYQAINGAVSKSQVLNLSVPVRDILSQFGPSAKQVKYQAGSEASCHDSALPSGPTTVNVWFLILDAGGTAQGTPTKYSLSVDVVGPAPPSSLSAAIGDTALILNWTASGDVDTQGYKVYCDPPSNGRTAPSADSGSSTPVDAGSTLVCADGGFTDASVDDSGDAIAGQPIDGGCSYVPNSSDSGSSSSSTCRSTVLVPSGGTRTTNEAGQTTVVGGSQKYVDPVYECASVGSASSSGAIAQGLTDGVFYTVAVAGIDNYGNIGPLSDPACETPQVILDFWDQYKRDHGGAGGGFCSVDGMGSTATAMPLTIFGLWAVFAAVRRRKKP